MKKREPKNERGRKCHPDCFCRSGAGFPIHCRGLDVDLRATAAANGVCENVLAEVARLKSSVLRHLPGARFVFANRKAAH